MAIESTCPGCNARLRVDDQHAGAKARCPQCGTVYSVPTAESQVHNAAPSNPTDAPPRPAANPPTWFLQIPEGQTYGPVKRAELDQWTSEGRVSADCLIRDSDTAPWRSATEFFPALALPPAASPFAAADSHPAAAPYVEPHRGGLILVLGLLSWVITCPVLSIAAWVMGTTDARKMDRGHMDREGLGLTQAGRILGMISAILWIVGSAVFLLVLIFLALAHATMR